MPLVTPSLDDRRFQDIVDQAKSLIPRYCPEWTDHNVSDPGVTLIELFAWMTDMLLFRVNQIPDRMFVKFLEMIGVRLSAPRSARAPVTFYLSAPQPNDVTIPEGTEVATLRTETNPAIIFTSEENLTIRPPVVLGAYSRSGSEGGASWIVHDLRQLSLPGRKLALFPAVPRPGDAFYIALERDHSQHVLALVIQCEIAGGAGVDPNNPPIEWQVYQGGVARWAPCVVEHDGTGGFNWSGEVILHIPRMAQSDLQGTQSYWLRCRLTDAQAGPVSYRVSPDVEQLRVEARGGTVSARHAVTVRGEALGTSDGTSSQSFRLLRAPLLARDPERDHLIVEQSGSQAERWQEVGDFAESNQGDHHYTLDGRDGQLTFGPALLQPDGTVYQFGATPPRGSVLRFSRYQHGGGVMGNVPKSALATLKTSIPYVARVTNRAPAVGGLDAQTLEEAKLLAPKVLRTRDRAVTADDYEHLAAQVLGVSRTRCLAPGAQPGDPADPRPGQVAIVVLPQVEAATERIPPEALTLSAELRAAVLSHLDQRRPLGIGLEIRAPNLVWVSVRARLRLGRSDQAGVAAAERSILAELYRYLNPVVGGPQGTGWPFGRDLYVSEIYGLLQQIDEVDFVEGVEVFVTEADGSASRPAPPRLTLPRHGLICSATHQLSFS